MEAAANDDRATLSPCSLTPTASDVGTTLVEIIITITMIGLVVLTLLASVQTSIIASSSAYDGSKIETVLLNAADRVARAPQLCDYEAYVDAAALAQGWDVGSISASTERLTGSSGDPIADWSAEVCPANVDAFDVQRVQVTATTPDGDTTRHMTVVKSDVD